MSDFTPKKQAKALLVQIGKKQKELDRLYKRLDKVQQSCKHPNGTTSSVNPNVSSNWFLFKCPDCNLEYIT